jgi:hypothetical protein
MDSRLRGNDVDSRLRGNDVVFELMEMPISQGLDVDRPDLQVRAYLFEIPKDL